MLDANKLNSTVPSNRPSVERDARSRPGFESEKSTPSTTGNGQKAAAPKRSFDQVLGDVHRTNQYDKTKTGTHHLKSPLATAPQTAVAVEPVVSFQRETSDAQVMHTRPAEGEEIKQQVRWENLGSETPARAAAIQTSPRGPASRSLGNLPRPESYVRFLDNRSAAVALRA